MALGYDPDLAQVLQRQGENERAADTYRECLVANPGYHACHYNLASLQLKAGNLDAAVAGFRRVVELRPNDAGDMGRCPSWVWPEARAGGPCELHG